MARRAGWRVLLRIEDLDGPRVKPESIGQTVDVLRWLGIDWDERVADQSSDLAPCREALASLHQRGLIYPCACTRKEIERAQSAPHAEDGETRYPGTCRDRQSPGSKVPSPTSTPPGATAWRLRVPEGPIAFEDALYGPQAIDVQAEVGDFIVATKQGLPAYQLAVVVDDARQGVTQVVRGDDLLGSTPRQVLLYRLLSPGSPPPRYTHLPLVVGEDGRRLAKRHGDTRLATYRDAGVPPERVIGLLAWWSGVSAAREPMSATAFAERFDLARLPRERVVFRKEDDAWLRG
jgi:glutamyl-tRNA synthetase